MLNDTQFVQESIAINLYYLRTLREFCLNLQTSLIAFQTTYIKEAEEIALLCEDIGNEITSFANGLVSQKALEYNIYVTDYTLECERLTEKLFNVKIDSNITKREQNLKGGNPTSVSNEIKEIMKRINDTAYDLANRFLTLSRKILDGINSNELFSYSYIALIEFMIYDTELFKTGLERLINQAQIDPSSVVNYEFYFNNSMKSISIFIKKLVDPKNTQISNEANWFENEFNKREEEYKVTALTPENQKNLTEKEEILVGEFHNFMEKCIEECLTRQAYFIIEPIFLDNMLTQINFFRYLLNYNRENQ